MPNDLSEMNAIPDDVFYTDNAYMRPDEFTGMRYTGQVTFRQAISSIIKWHTPDRVFNVPDGMAKSVWEDKYARRKENGESQTWSERLKEVVHGNFLLDSTALYTDQEVVDTLDLALKGVMPFSGRHLQHGDSDQPNKNIELFTNCSTAIFCFSSFWLLLNGSGVGADYSSYTRRVNFSKHMPHIRMVLDGGLYDDGNVANGAHPDFKQAATEFSGYFESKREALHKYPPNSEQVRWFTVEDSREGWAQVMSIIETAAWQEKHADKLFIFDWSAVRESGAPIAGQQNRPASGPLPVMRAFSKIANIKGIPDMAPWKQALYIDHYTASCVALGGVRRAARMATKWYRDPDIFDFIEIKRGGHLWSANISILVDKAFWAEAKDPRTHSARVYQAITGAQYMDQTGEPGIINVDMLNNDKTGLETITGENYINPNAKLKLHDRTKDMMGKILSYLKKMEYPFIVNPCAEIPLALWGGFCVIGDICLANAESIEEVKTAARMMPRALIRVNLMESLYKKEVERTNRIGVSLTGIHEFIAKHFQINFYDIVNVLTQVSDPSRFARLTESQISARRKRALDFWFLIRDMREIAEKSAAEYSAMLGVATPHTITTIKPSGTISKVLDCTEGAHLPPVVHYIRWNQIIKTIPGTDTLNPELAKYEAAGYPIKDVSHQYPNYMVVGFPKMQRIGELLPPDELVTSEDTTPAEQFEWIRLLERFWFGTKEDGSSANSQVSYTMKYDPNKISFLEYIEMLAKEQSTVRCCAIMPIVDMSTYAYQPEEKISASEYQALIDNINTNIKKDLEALDSAYDDDALSCAGGICAVDESINRATLA